MHSGFVSNGRGSCRLARAHNRLAFVYSRSRCRGIFYPPTFLSGGIEYTIPPGYFARLSNYDAAESLVSSFRGFREVI